MARQVIVKIGGEDRELWFDARDGIAIRKELGKRPRAVLEDDILGLVDGKPSWDTDLHALAVVLQRGLSHDGKGGRDAAVTYDKVVDWLTGYIAVNPVMVLGYAVQEAIYMSGILGVAVDLREVSKQLEATEEAEGGESAGKALASTTATVSPTPLTATPTT